MILQQLAVGGLDENFSYLVADELSREGMVIDPCGNVEIILKGIKERNIKLKYILNTHAHIDHIEGNEAISRTTKAQVVCHRIESSLIHPDITVENQDVLKLGDLKVKIIHTPGHTHGSICALVDNALFTGDTLFVGYCGKTNSSKSSEELYHSLFDKIARFPDDTKIYSGHNYGEKPFSTIKYEKSHNPYYQCPNKKEFIELRRKGV